MSHSSEPGSAAPPLEERLLELLDLEPGPRGDRLEEIERESPVLADELRRLLIADSEADGPLEKLRTLVGDSALAWADDSAPPPPERVGAWRLVSRLGAGGMGEVWLGERVEGGFAQQAAIKLVRAGAVSQETLERFRLERQVLARLSHPSIAALLDGGVAADGRPWFAMERVDGVPINEFAASRALGLEARVALIVEVAEAVAFAHRALVVHRDLKPSNVLVDAEGRPKLLDFGLAKLLEQELDPHLTRTEMRALTPAWAAPEQVLGEPITTATDVYALGLLLYQLLTGALPHERAASSPAELAALVAHESIERPSSRLRRAAVGAEPSSPPRPARTSREAARLRGDLDTIVLKALAREPVRRYPGAAAFADDLRRFLDGRPVAARPDTVRYLAGKFVRRHRAGVAAGALAALSLVGGATAALLQAGRANRAAARATDHAARARAEGERAKRMKDFLISVFQEASPMQRARGTPLAIEELLSAAEARIDAELAAEPLLQADLWDDLAETRASAGDLDAASVLIDKALAAKRAHLPPDDLSLVESLVNRGAIWNLSASQALRDFSTSRPDASAAEQATKKAELARRSDAAIAALDEARAILVRRGEPESEPAVNLAINRVHALLAVERDDEAAIEADLAVRLADRFLPGSPAAAMQHHNGGLIATRRGRHDEAKAHYEAAIAKLEPIVGADHALVSLPVVALADLLETALHDIPAALPYYERALAIARKNYPAGHAKIHERESDLAAARARLAGRQP